MFENTMRSQYIVPCVILAVNSGCTAFQTLLSVSIVMYLIVGSPSVE